MKVWLVWEGEYSGACVVGVYSSLELADAACRHDSSFWIDDRNGYDIDADAERARSDQSRWNVLFDANGNMLGAPHAVGFATGAMPCVDDGFLRDKEYARTRPSWWIKSSTDLVINLDARDVDHALKSAADHRRMYLASGAREKQLRVGR